VESTVTRIVVLAPNWLGDVVMALPAVAALRQWHAGAHLAVAARPSVAPILTLAEGVDEVVTLAARGDWRDSAGRRADARRLSEGRFDLAVLLPNSFQTAWVVRQAGIPERWGYAADARRLLLTRAVHRRRGLTQAAYYAALVSALGGPEAPMTAALRVPEDVDRAADAMLRERGWHGEPLVAFAPGAAFGPAKRWPPERAGQVAARLRRDARLTPLFVGTRADQPAIDAALAAYRAECGSDALALDLGGRTDLPMLTAVLARCRAALCNDSGAMHVAAAVGTPVAAIFGPTDERFTSPLPHPSGAGFVALTGYASCRPCHLRLCPIDHRCMTSVEAADVAETIRGRMRDPGGSLS
jgi:heptosyltransferase-2